MHILTGNHVGGKAKGCFDEGKGGARGAGGRGGPSGQQAGAREGGREGRWASWQQQQQEKGGKVINKGWQGLIGDDARGL